MAHALAEVEGIEFHGSSVIISVALPNGIVLTNGAGGVAIPTGHMSARRSSQPDDLFAFEREQFGLGLRRVAGVDEAGRGPLAGPVVAAAVVLPPGWVADGLPPALKGLTDSKQLSEAQRERFFEALLELPATQRGVAVVEADEIDRRNILQATHHAMNLALAQLNPPPEHVLVDGRPVKTLRFAHTALVKGDARSYSIAAASVLAKVTRDRLMREHHERWPQYGFAEHKGYGTAAHLAAIATHGPCPIHRMTFAPLKPRQAELL